MNDLDDQKLDQLLRDHLGASLDGQLGRLGQFQEPWNAPPPAPGLPRSWRWAYAVTGLAACLAIALLAADKWLGHTAIPLPRPLAQNDPDVSTVQYQQGSVFWDTLDEGTVIMSDNTPARRLRRQILHQVQLYDTEHQATVEVATPSEEIIYVQLPTY